MKVTVNHKEYDYVDYKKGDIVMHKVLRWKGQVTVCYDRLNKCEVLVDGKRLEYPMTALVKADW